MKYAHVDDNKQLKLKDLPRLLLLQLCKLRVQGLQRALVEARAHFAGVTQRLAGCVSRADQQRTKAADATPAPSRPQSTRAWRYSFSRDP